MAIRKWSRQAFLNPADSNDDGWFKFSIRPRKHGFSDVFIISDCSNKIYLEFNVDAYSEFTSKEDLRSRLRQIPARRRKLILFRDAIVQACNRWLAALDETEADIKSLLEKESA